MDEVTRCSYVNCIDIQKNEQILHELPVFDTGLCVKWLINSGHENLIGKDFGDLRSLKFFICNNHFSNDCYLAKGTLKDNAVPRPHWNESNVSDCLSNHKSSTVSHSEKNFENHLSANDYLQNICNPKEWCRTCATKKSNLISMTTKKKQNEISLLTKLKLLIDIEDDDVLPKSICCDCILKLEQSFQFFHQIYLADNALRRIFPKNFKTLLNYENTRDNFHVNDNRVNINSNFTFINNNDQDEHHKLGERIDNSEEFEKITVYSLLTDDCHSEEELVFSDVLHIMSTQNNLNVESNKQSSKTTIRCEYCNSKFKFRRQLKTHITMNHCKSDDKLCADCMIRISDETEFIEHRVLCHKDKTYHCDYCQKILLKKRELRKHINKKHVTNNDTNINIINKINEITTDIVSEQNEKKNVTIDPMLKSPVRIVLNEMNSESNVDGVTTELMNNENPSKKRKIVYRCKACFTSFINSDDLETHCKTHSAEDFKNISKTCLECNLEMSNIKKLQLHKMKCHFASEGDFTCLLCDEKIFQTLEEYNQHINNHEEEQENFM